MGLFACSDMSHNSSNLAPAVGSPERPDLAQLSSSSSYGNVSGSVAEADDLSIKGYKSARVVPGSRRL